MTTLRTVSTGAICIAAALCGCGADDEKAPLRMVVMDPLALPLACDCVGGYAQRRYDRLAAFLEGNLGRPVQVAFTEDLLAVTRRGEGAIHLVIGKRSVVGHDAARAKLAVRPVARLTDTAGGTELTGLFVVRTADAAKGLTDLAGRQVLFGPPESDEKHAAALAALAAAGVAAPAHPLTVPSCSGAAVEVVEGRADAAVISSYALALLEGCGNIDKGALRVVGRTGPVPFVTAFATGCVSAEMEKRLLSALLAMRDDADLLKAMESRDGFVPVEGAAEAGWTDWRGPGRTAVSGDVPRRLPEKARFLWRRPLTGVGLSGVAATGQVVLVADKDAERKNDVWRCLRADDGREMWTVSCPAAGEMDYSNSPRATPVIRGGLAYLLGAFGDLCCVRLETGQVVWKMNVIRRFGAKLTQWGQCSTPLVVDERLVVNPGAPEASVVALDRRTGKVLWASPGRQPAYASFVAATLGGVRQVVGYDATTLGGWDIATGRRLWTLVPEQEGDFNVPTPVVAGGKLLVTTENNGTRLYAFDDGGQIRPRPVAHHDELASDTQTPVVLAGRAFGSWGRMFCLDLAGGLRTVWAHEDPIYDDYAALIAGNGRVLVLTVDGRLVLLDAEADAYTELGRLKLYGDERTEIFSHPALVGRRLYVRDATSIACVLLE